MSTKIKRSPPTAKRHTKPCRYYQTQSCAKSAEECDFLHVISLAPALSPSKKLCKYFLAGACTNAMHCRFVHATTTAAPTPHIAAAPAYAEGNVPYPYTHMHDAGYRYYAVPPPVYVPWPQVPYPSLNPLPRRRQRSEADSSTVSECEHPISSSAASLIVLPTLDNSASFFEDHDRGVDAGARRPSSFRYKTKPCKYMQAGRACPEGDQCTFLHQGEHPPSHPETLPEKPLSAKEQGMKRGLYPVNWRVIGGGVPLNIQAEELNREYVQRPYDSDVDVSLHSDEDDKDEHNYLDKSTIAQPKPHGGLAVTEMPAGEIYGHLGYPLKVKAGPRTNPIPVRASPPRPGSV
ncbi:hypothetical protein CYLTODRAFT_425695 [Cylindrobasidium torrendii FP15055 ss-10]|uniref:C3H1-type domain-containing protein n=1 Tax=Cylindrobasidium torrendii FP15055 ss-10 TaxID=1314674 RepID=A0A0D7AZX2_9AGAR|nr:hypothetical protein CYLTODRAFT_425695 [Cylindrobasidium torrendii FP15055 ss-10]